MFPIFSKIDPPLLLKPNPPANTHIIPYTKYQKTMMRQDIEHSRQKSLLYEIQKMNKMSQKRQEYFAEQKQKLMKNIVLLSLEVEHMREIHCQYEHRLKTSQETCNDLEQMYEMKLQQIKTQLVDSFYEEMAIEKQKTMKDFLQLKQIYNKKIGLISQSTKNKQLEFDLKVQQAHDRALKIQLYQCKIIQKQKAISKFTNKIAQLEQQNNEKQEIIHLLQDKLQKQEKSNLQTISSLKIRVIDLSSINQELLQQLKQMKQSSYETHQQIVTIEQQKKKLINELESSLKKMNRLQKQVDQLNRKTYKNKEIPPNGHQPREATERQREHYMTQNQILGTITGTKQANLIYKVKQMQEQIKQRQQEIDKLSSIIKKHQQNIREYEQRIRELSQKMSEMEANQKKVNDLQTSLVEINKQKTVNDCKFDELKLRQDKLSQEITLLNQKNTKNQQLLRQKDTQLAQLKQQITQASEQYGQKLTILTKRTSNLQIQWRDKEKQMHILQNNIQSQYLKEISALKNQVQSLQKTLVDTNLMFQNMEIKRSEHKKSKNKDKKKQ